MLKKIKAERRKASGGIVLRQGEQFILTTRKELREHGIEVRRTGREVIYGGATKPVWEKKNWNYCDQIARLFREYKAAHGMVYNLDAFLVHEIVVCDHAGIHVERPQFCNVW